jgi:outer membrane lipoprotein SlyB
MFERSKSIRARSGGARTRAFRLTWLAMAAAFLLLATGESQACPKGDEARQEKTVAAVVDTPAAEVVVAATASTSVGTGSAAGIGCCGQCGGIACGGGQCSACAPALLAVASGIILEDVSQVYALPFQAGLRLRKPPPDFRPPRISA